MSNADLHSIISIYGAVRAVNRPNPEGADSTQRSECRFAIENEDGRFSVQATLLPEECDRLPASRVQVIGTLRSSFFRQCHQHHQLIEAFLIVILGRTKSGKPKVLAVLESERGSGPGFEQWKQLIKKG